MCSETPSSQHSERDRAEPWKNHQGYTSRCKLVPTSAADFCAYVSRQITARALLCSSLKAMVKPFYTPAISDVGISCAPKSCLP